MAGIFIGYFAIKPIPKLFSKKKVENKKKIKFMRKTWK
jgi:hypothetical protein